MKSLPLLFIIINTVLSLTVMYTCICRQTASGSQVLPRVRLGYSLLGTFWLVMLLCPFWTWPSYEHLAASAGVLAVLFSGSHRWKHGAPNDVKYDWAKYLPERRS